MHVQSRSVTSLAKNGGSEDDGSSSSSSVSDAETTTKGSQEPSQKQNEEDPQMKSEYSWNRKIATHSDGETILPLSAVAVDQAKSLGYELVVQVSCLFAFGGAAD